MKKIIFFISIILIPFCCLGKVTSKSKAAQKDPEAVFSQGIEAFMDYNFEEAADLFDEYESLQTKKKKPLDDNFDTFQKQLNIAGNAFDRVEKIIIIDSLSLSKSDFYKKYNLPSSSGRIVMGNELSNNPGLNDLQYCFVNETGDNVFWTSISPDSLPIVNEGVLLLDGSWEINSHEIPSFQATEIEFPFVCSDGQTFYFSAKGDESMGGYDLFVAQRDPISGEFRQPLNLGMPYNSPFDDVLLALDEENGIGWWATQRNSDEDKITVYVYIVNEIRENYPSDEENLVSFAKITDYKNTQPENKGNQIKELKKILADNLSPENKKKNIEFSLPMDGGKTYHTLTDFKNRQASQQMQKLLAKEKELARLEKRLTDISKSQSKRSGSNSQLTELESKVDNLRKDVIASRNEVYRLERNKK